MSERVAAADSAPPGALPAADPAASAAVDTGAAIPRHAARPRNYLAGGERRRIFWLVMPPAIVAMLLLGWVERQWFGRHDAPAPPQVDTRLKEGPAGASDPFDAVVIEPDPEPPPGVPDDSGAPREALAQIRDDTIFRGVEQEAWFQIWLTLRSTDPRGLARADVRRVSFGELYGQPRSYRGRLVRFGGTLRRLEKMDAPANPYDIREYWQGWLEPAGGPASPIVVYFLRLPDGMPHGLRIGEPVEVVGYFFKRWAYAATDAVRIAPLVMALEPIWRPRPVDDRAGDSLGTVALVTMTAVVLLTMLGIRAAGRGPARRRPPPPADLATSLSNVDVFSTAEALRRLELSERTPGPSPLEEPPP